MKPKITAKSRPLRKRAIEMPLMPAMCATCPFREGSPFAVLRKDLTMSALTEASRICHSTGSNNGINHRTGKPPHLCRGARDIQLGYWHGIGFIEAPTDEAWTKKCKEMGILPNQPK